MAKRHRVFLDTSALFAGLWSAEGGARVILKLGEAGTLQLLVSSQVLTELEGALRRKGPALVSQVALVLDRAGVAVTEQASSERVRSSQVLVDHAADARVLADAWKASVGFFVTLDKAHFLGNDPLRAALPFPMGTPGDFLVWYRNQLGS